MSAARFIGRTQVDDLTGTSAAEGFRCADCGAEHSIEKANAIDERGLEILCCDICAERRETKSHEASVHYEPDTDEHEDSIPPSRADNDNGADICFAEVAS